MVPTTPVILLSLGPAVVLVGLMTRGPAILLPAVIGQVAFDWINATDPAMVVGHCLGLIAGPVLAAAVLKQFSTPGSKRSHLVQCGRLFSAGVLLMAPVSALFVSLTYLSANPNGMKPFVYFAWQWGAIATAAVVFVRGLMSWMPSNGSGFCPVRSISSIKAGRQTLLNILPVLIITAVAAGSLIAGTGSTGFIERTMVIPLFAFSCACAVFQNRRHAVNAIMLAGYLNTILRLEGYKVGEINDSAVALPMLGEFVVLLLVGSMLSHLLNALTEERNFQSVQLEHQARTNALTDLPNLRSLIHYLNTLADRADRTAGNLQMAEISVPEIHQWADLASRTDATRVEKEMASRLREALSSRLDQLFHLDTGRFVLVFSNPLSNAEISAALREVFEQTRFRIGQHRLRLPYSVGVVDLPAGCKEPETVLAFLAIAQRQAAGAESNYCRMEFDARQVSHYRRGMQWTEKVKSYLDNDALLLFAQPIRSGSANRESNNTLYYEVLTRIRTNSGKVLTPDKFLPAIEKSGLLIRFDQAVIRKTLSTLQSNRPLLDMTGLCSVNVTGPSICSVGFDEFLSKTLDATGIDPKRLSIEITESDSITNLESALKNISAIRQLGVKVAVDDFGTGMATFDYIRQLRPDLVKIDGAFVRQYENDPLDREIVHSITRLARSINAKTVAEYVEDDIIAASMLGIGVDFLQGWAISKPLPIEELVNYRAHMVPRVPVDWQPIRQPSIPRHQAASAGITHDGESQ